MRTLKILLLFSALLASPLASAYDARWPDYGVASEGRGSGPGEYSQGFESPCFAPPLQPASAENDWIRFYSELVRVDTGFAGIFSPAGFNHAEVRPPLPMPPGVLRGLPWGKAGWHWWCCRLESSGRSGCVSGRSVAFSAER